MSNGKILEVVCNNATYYFEVDHDDLINLLGTVPRGEPFSVDEMNRLHRDLWTLLNKAKKASIHCTEEVEFGLIDDTNDPDSSWDSWQEQSAELFDEE